MVLLSSHLLSRYVPLACAHVEVVCSSLALLLFLQLGIPMSAIAGDDPRDPSAERKLSFPDTWQAESSGAFQTMSKLSW